MKVSQVNYTIFAPYLVKTNNDLKVKNASNPQKTDRITELSSVYYRPLSFKSQPKSKEYEILENKLDEFYEENKGKDLKNLKADFYNFELTSSRITNNDFKHFLDNEIFEANLNKGLPLNIAQEALKAGVYAAVSDINEEADYGVLGKDELLEKVSKDTEKILSKVDINEFIPSFPMERRPQGFSEMAASIRKKFMEYYPDIDRRIIVNNFGEFVNAWFKYIDENNKPVFDEQLYQSMKTGLKEEPFKAFNEQMLKVEAQRAKNTVTATQVANELYEDLLNKKVSPFDNPKFYDYLRNNDENIDFLLENIYGFFYPDLKAVLEQELNMDKKHKILFADPAMGAYASDFIKYVKENNVNLDSVEPFELRKSFSDYLGTETIYRGVTAKNPEEVINKIKEEGHFASVLNNKDKAINAIKYYLINDDGVTNTVFGRISNKVSNPQKGHEFLSASSVYQIAASVQKQYDYPVVVMKAEVPKLSLIKQKGVFGNRQSSAIHKTLYVGYTRFPYDRDQEKIESFIPFNMPLSNAEFIVDKETPRFRWEQDYFY